jgi:predicted phage gp36 major capsid-like protein
MKAHGLLVLLAVLGSPISGAPAMAQNIPEELRQYFQDRREEFRERREEFRERREEFRERREEFREPRDEVREIMFRLHRACDEGDRRACIQFGMIIGENREHRAQWRREHPELFGWDRR